MVSWDFYNLNGIEYCFHMRKSEVRSIDQPTATTTSRQQIDSVARLITLDTLCIEGKPLE